MKHINKLIFIVLFALLICCLIGCKDAAVKFSPSVYELNMNQDWITEGNHEFDHKYGDIKFQWFTDESVEKSIKVVFNGQEYECSYLWSVRFAFENYQLDEYKIEPGTILIRHDTKGLVNISNANYPEESTEGAVLISEESARQVFESFIEQYVNLQDFRVIQPVESDVFYNFRYSKYFDDIKTVEYISVTVGKYDGRIHSFSTRMMNELDEASLQENRDLIMNLAEVSDSLVDEKILEIYKDSEHYAGYEVWDSFLCKLDDGGYGFAYIVDVHYEDGTGLGAGDVIYLLVTDE